MSAHAAPVCFVVGARPNFMKVGAGASRALRSRRTDAARPYGAALRRRDVGRLPRASSACRSPTSSSASARARTASRRRGRSSASRQVLLEQQPGRRRRRRATSTRRSPARSPPRSSASRSRTSRPGLRSFDPSMPEEHNRRLTDHLSELLLVALARAHSTTSRARGSKPSTVAARRQHDDRLAARARRRTREPTPRGPRYGFEPGTYGLVTLHRPALVDDPDLLARDGRALAELARDAAAPLPGAPAHVAAASRHSTSRGGRACSSPARSATSSSSGSRRARASCSPTRAACRRRRRRSASRCFTLRDTTERPVTVELGTNTLLGLDPTRIAEIPALLEQRAAGDADPALGRTRRRARGRRDLRRSWRRRERRWRCD